MPLRRLKHLKVGGAAMPSLILLTVKGVSLWLQDNRMNKTFRVVGLWLQFPSTTADETLDVTRPQEDHHTFGQSIGPII